MQDCCRYQKYSIDALISWFRSISSRMLELPRVNTNRSSSSSSSQPNPARHTLVNQPAKHRALLQAKQ